MAAIPNTHVRLANSASAGIGPSTHTPTCTVRALAMRRTQPPPTSLGLGVQPNNSNARRTVPRAAWDMDLSGIKEMELPQFGIDWEKELEEDWATGMEYAEEIPMSPDDWMPWHLHEDADKRAPYLQLQVGAKLTGPVTALLAEHGIMVDLGATYDALCYVPEGEWQRVFDMVPIDQVCTVRVKAVHPDNGRYVFPVEVDILDPPVTSALSVTSREFPPVYWSDLDHLRPLAELAFETGRPMPETTDEFGRVESAEDLEDNEEGLLEDQDDMDVPALDLLASAGLDFDPDELDNLLEQDDNDVIDV